MQIVAVYLLWGVWIFTWLAAVMGTPHSARKLSALQDFIYKIVVLAATFLLFTITPFPGFDVQYRLWDRALDESWSWVLLGVAFVGFALAWWSTLYRLAVRKRHRDVIDTGPYGLMRHPMYTGLIIAAFATAVMFGRPSSLAGATLLVLAFAVRSFIEEQVMREESSAFEDYTGRVPMFVPFFPTGDKAARRMPESVPPVAHAISEPPAPRVTEPVLAPEPISGPDAFQAPVMTAPADKVVSEERPQAKAVQLSLLLEDDRSPS